MKTVVIVIVLLFFCLGTSFGGSNPQAIDTSRWMVSVDAAVTQGALFSPERLEAVSLGWVVGPGYVLTTEYPIGTLSIGGFQAEVVHVDSSSHLKMLRVHTDPNIPPMPLASLPAGRDRKRVWIVKGRDFAQWGTYSSEVTVIPPAYPDGLFRVPGDVRPLVGPGSGFFTKANEFVSIAAELDQLNNVILVPRPEIVRAFISRYAH